MTSVETTNFARHAARSEAQSQHPPPPGRRLGGGGSCHFAPDDTPREGIE